MPTIVPQLLDAVQVAVGSDGQKAVLTGTTLRCISVDSLLLASGKLYLWRDGTPEVAPVPSGHHVVQVALGGLGQVGPATSLSLLTRQVFALTGNGTLFAWGSGDGGALGNNSTSAVLRPQVVEHVMGCRVVTVACGHQHSLLLTGM